MKLAIFSLIALAGITSAQQDSLKVASVDMQTLFKNFYRTAEMQAENATYQQRIVTSNNEREANVKKVREEAEALKKQIEDPAVADDKKQSVFVQWQAKQQQADALERDRLRSLQTKAAALNDHVGQQVKIVYSEIQALVQEHARQEGYDFVFDKSGQTISLWPALLYTKDATDITELLLKDLNKNAPEGAKLPALPGSE